MSLTRKRHLALLLLALLATLACLETVLRLVRLPGRVRSGWSWNDSPRRSLANYPDDHPNQLGFRGQPIRYDRHDYVVLLLGDGQVEAAGVPPERMPEKLLQKELSLRLKRPVKVFSLAAAGFGQDQQLIALERYYRTHRADLVLVWATPDDDFWENAFPDRSTTSVAGPLKPTYRLVGERLEGPRYRSDFYLYHSALLQLAVKSYAGWRGRSLEQVILERWQSELPPSHEVVHGSDQVLSRGLIALGHKEYAENRYHLNPNWRFLLLTSEDYYQSRSHFSPFLAQRSPRDNYLVDLTRKLYQQIGVTSRQNKSQFRVFFPELGNGAYSDKLLVSCVQNLWEGRPVRQVVKDEAALLRSVLPLQELMLVQVPGGRELSLGGVERQLSDAGNEKAMRQLAGMLVR